MWRVIIRWSFNGDAGSVMRNSLATLLAGCGIFNTPGATGTWGCPAATAAKAAATMAEVLRRLANPAMVAGTAPGFSLDHIWVYIDRNQIGV